MQVEAFRWVVLALASLLLFGNYYSYDNPSALDTQLQEYLGITDDSTYNYQFNLLYSIYSFPNIILPLFGGLFLDWFGTNRMLITLSVLVCVGQAVFALGVSFKTFWIMVLGRLLFGLGAESLSVAQSRVTVRWFKGKEMAFALGVNLSIARLGSVANDNASPRIASALDVPAALWVGLGMCLASLCCAVMLVAIDSVHGKRIEKKMRSDAKEAEFKASSEASTPTAAQNGHATPFPPHADAAGYHLVEDETSHKEGTRAESSLVPAQGNGVVEEDEEETEPPIKCADFKKFSLSFWLLCILCVCLYGTVGPFHNIANDFLVKKYYPGNPSFASTVMGVPDTISAVSAPVWGIMVDLYGHRGFVMLLSAVFIMVVHLLLSFTTFTPIPPLIFLGLGYSWYSAAIWPSVALLCDENLVATAYGISTSMLNGSLTLWPVVVSLIFDRTGDYQGVTLFFAATAFAGIVLCLILMYMDRHTHVLATGLRESAQRRRAAAASADDDRDPLLLSSGAASVSSQSIVVTTATVSAHPQHAHAHPTENSPVLGILYSPPLVGTYPDSPDGGALVVPAGHLGHHGHDLTGGAVASPTYGSFADARLMQQRTPGGVSFVSLHTLPEHLNLAGSSPAGSVVPSPHVRHARLADSNSAQSSLARSPQAHLPSSHATTPSLRSAVLHDVAAPARARRTRTQSERSTDSLLSHEQEMFAGIEERD